MNRSLSLFAIGLVFGGGIGFAIAAGNGVTFDGHDHGAMVSGMDHGNMDHAMMHDAPVEVPATDAPQVTLKVMPDPMAGYNLHLQIDNFTFSPERASLANVTGEGHAHVYINGEKLGRLYSPWMHIDGLPKGEVEVKVTLNTNDHRPLAVNGTPVSATQMITVE
jgi:hypothetical protein